jgi:glycosyltransferase involved in cell wall biosynthesis
VIVVDGMSEDSTIETVKDFSGVKIICNKEDTPGLARNRGAENANGDILFFCDSDCIVDKRNLESHILAYQRRKDIVGVMGSIRQSNNENLVSNYIQRQMMTSEWSGNIQKDGTIISYLNTANFSVKRDVFLDIRFREDLISSEDVEFFIRLKQQGYQILYEPRAVSYHHHPSTVEELFARFMWYGQGFSQIDKLVGKEMRNRYRILSPARYLDCSEASLKEAVISDNRQLCQDCIFDQLQNCQIRTTQILKKKIWSEVDLHRVVCLALAAGVLKQRMGMNYKPTMRRYLKEKDS